MTSETRLLDYSDARPSPKEIVQRGYVGVIRYVAPGPNPKIMTLAEVKALHAEDLTINLVFESTATESTQGSAAAGRDLATATKEAKALGYPTACPIWFAVDEAAAVASVSPYFNALFGDKAAYPLGPYGDDTIVNGVLAKHANAYLWQTAAWSSGVLSPHAHLYQRAKAEGNPPSGCDEDVVCRPFPAWGPKGVVMLQPGGVKPAPPKPVPDPHHGPTTLAEQTVKAAHAILDNSKIMNGNLHGRTNAVAAQGGERNLLEAVAAELKISDAEITRVLGIPLN